jgi:hypothetical protein
MAPTTAKTSRSSVKGLITKKINQPKTYDLVEMTLKTSNELEDLKLDLKETFGKFQQLSLKIQEDLNTMDAPQEDYETEEDYCRNVKDEINAARVILKTKQMEWDAIKKTEEEDLEAKKAWKLKKQEMEKAAEIEKQKEEDRDKKLLHLLQQQQFQQVNTDKMQQVIAAIPAAAAPNVTVNAPVGVAQATRLPQRQIRHFKGDILEWTPFWETFNAAISSLSISAYISLSNLASQRYKNLTI